MPAKVYTDKDADLGVFQNKTLAVLGYGSQGHAHALNLKESGVKVIIGLYKGSKSIEAAKTYKVAGWAPVAEGVKGEAIWDLVGRHLRSKRIIKSPRLNTPVLAGVTGNRGLM